MAAADLLAPLSVHLSPSSLPHRFTPQQSSQSCSTTQPWHWLPTRTACVSDRPRRNSGQRNRNSEAQRFVRALLRGFTRKRSLTTTLDKHVHTVRTEHCFLLFEELGKRDTWPQCLEVFRWMQKQCWYIADSAIYSKIIAVMGKTGKTRMASRLFTEMRNSGCQPDTSVYNALITAQVHSQDKSRGLPKSLTYFNKMKGLQHCKPNIVTYNILLRAFAQARDVHQVNALFKDLKETIIAPDVYTYNSLMNAYGKNGMIKEMESMLSCMKQDQCKPNIITFNLLIDSYGKKQEFGKMEQVFKSLLCSKERPTLLTFNSMITSYGKAGLQEKAEHVFAMMTNMKYSPSSVTYECLIMMYGYCNCVSRAQDLFDGLLASRKEVQVSTLNAMLYAYCLNGLLEEADKFFESACCNGMVPNSLTYKILYRAYTKANMKGLVQKLLKRIDKNGIIPNKNFFLDALGTFGSFPEIPESHNGVNGLSELQDCTMT